MIKKIWSFIMSVVMFLCALFGIDIGGGSGETGEMITYNDEKTIVTVSLDENPSTGYGWEYALSADGIVTLTADEYHPDETEPGVAGAGGVPDVLRRAYRDADERVRALQPAMRRVDHDRPRRHMGRRQLFTVHFH